MSSDSSEGDERRDVYFIVSVQKRRCKIGSSQNPYSRMGSLQTASAEKLRLVQTIENAGQRTEEALQRAAQADHINREWYELSKEHIAKLADWGETYASFVRDGQPVSKTDVPPPPGWGSVEYVADQFDISERTVYRWRDRGKMVRDEFGKNTYYRHVDHPLFRDGAVQSDVVSLNPEEIDRYIEQNRKRVVQEIVLDKNVVDKLKRYCVKNGYTLDQVAEYAINRLIED